MYLDESGMDPVQNMQSHLICSSRQNYSDIPNAIMHLVWPKHLDIFNTHVACWSEHKLNTFRQPGHFVVNPQSMHIVSLMETNLSNQYPLIWSGRFKIYYNTLALTFIMVPTGNPFQNSLHFPWVLPWFSLVFPDIETLFKCLLTSYAIRDLLKIKLHVEVM